MTDGVEHLVVCLLALWISSFVKRLFSSESFSSLPVVQVKRQWWLCQASPNPRRRQVSYAGGRPLPCAHLFASTPSLALAVHWPASSCRQLDSVISSRSDAHPRDLPGPLPEARSLRSRTHEHAEASRLLIRVPRAAGVRASPGRARDHSRGPGRGGRGPPAAGLHSAVPCSPGGVCPRRTVTGKSVSAPPCVES